MREGRWAWVIAVAVLGLFTALYTYRGGETLWFLLVLAGFIILQGLVFCWLGPKHVQASRSWKPYYPQAGEPLEMEIVLTISGGIVPLSMRARDSWSVSGREAGASSVILTGEGEITGKLRGWIGQQQQFSCTYVLQPSTRGHYKAGELAVMWSDPFGWFKRKKRVAVNGQDILVIHPAPLPVSLESEASPRGAWESQQAMGRFLPAPMEEADGLRKYLPGDSFKWVEWKHSAKRGELLTRVSREPLAEEHYLLLDTDLDSYRLEETGKNGRREAVQGFETAISAASAILHRELTHPRREFSLENKQAASTWFICGKRASRDLEEEQLRGGEGLISGLNRLAGLSLDNGEKGLNAASILRSLPRSSKGYRLTLITGRCTEEVTDAVLVEAARGGDFEVLLASELIMGMEETARIERLRNTGIRVIALAPGLYQKQPLIKGLPANTLSSKGGAGHVIA